MTTWTIAAASVALLEPVAAFTAWRYRLTKPLPSLMIYLVFLIPFRITWALAPEYTQQGPRCGPTPPPFLLRPDFHDFMTCIRPVWSFWALDIARVLVTIATIRLLLWNIEWGTGERAIRWRWVLVAGFGGAVLAAWAHSTWFALARVLCFVALATSLLLSTAWRHPTIDFQAKHAAIMTVFMGSSAFASLAGSVRGDVWDAGACAVQAACSVAWILMLRGRI